jgi:hypothetical protein
MSSDVDVAKLQMCFCIAFESKSKQEFNSIRVAKSQSSSWDDESSIHVQRADEGNESDIAISAQISAFLALQWVCCSGRK